MDEKKALGKVYALKIEGFKPTVEEVAKRYETPPKEMQKRLDRLVQRSLLVEGPEYALTPKGRSKLRVVMIGGAFEIIHPGHLHTIREARRLGDILVVVVATDKTVAKNKGRNAITSERLRVELVSSIRHVDAAVLGGEGSIYDTLEKVRPDVVALGYDQRHREDEIEKEAERRGVHVKVVRLSTPIPSVKTSRIVDQFA